MTKLVAWLCLACSLPIIATCFIFGAVAAEAFIWVRVGWTWAWRVTDDMITEAME